MSFSCCLIILNYNGIIFLEKCLSSALLAAENAESDCSVICVDNISDDESVAYIRDNFPEVELVISRKNDFLFSLNDVVEERTEDIVVVLNNDMHFDKGFILPLLSHFEDETVFAVGASILNWTGTHQTIGPRYGKIKNFWFYKWFDLDKQIPKFSLEACGGASAYRRRMFVNLGGFDSLYRPGYYEDLDLSYRAWSQGWKSIYEPKSAVYHKTSASMIKKYGADRKTRMHSRNHILFTAKNIGGWSFLFCFILLLPIRCIRQIIVGRRSLALGIVDSFPLLPKAVYSRLIQNRLAKHSTKEILSNLAQEIG